jgi:hypothetical protein
VRYAERAKVVLKSDSPAVAWAQEINFSRSRVEQASAGLERIVLGSLRHAPPSEAPLLAWPLVCGSVVAERTRALEFIGTALRVEVPDAGWKREMQSLAPRYLAAMNRYAGQKVEN